jgi:adenine-specific DNA-methyltransferase
MVHCAFMSIAPTPALFPDLPLEVELPTRAKVFPQLRYMGSKSRLLPWIHQTLLGLSFESALDAFAGSGCISYLFKTMGKRVLTNDFLEFSHQIGIATVVNDRYRLTSEHCEVLLRDNPGRQRFIETTFKDIFFAQKDLRFLDNLWANLPALPTRYHRAVALAAATRACVKKQPRGVFTVSGNPTQYDDGRRDLHVSLEAQFLECAAAYNSVVFDNDERHEATRQDVLAGAFPGVDLVYMDPPYVPRADDNCYIKRYHFLEGLASYWQNADTEILSETKVKKIKKRFTPFSYRHSAVAAFDEMFRKFSDSTLILSYSSNGFPDRSILCDLMHKYKHRVDVIERDHRYHFGTHAGVSPDRTQVKEYLIIGD